MLYGLTGIRNFHLKAKDGEVGLCDDILFDDRDWSVLYMVVLLRTWLPGRKFLIPHEAFGRLDREKAEINLDLTMAEIKKAEPLEAHPPLAMQRRGEFARLFLIASGCLPTDANLSGKDESTDDGTEPNEAQHLRSAKELSRYKVAAIDGDCGYVQDLLASDEDDEIRYLVVDLGRWIKKRAVMVPPEWISSVDWDNRQINLNRNKETIKKQPLYEQC